MKGMNVVAQTMRVPFGYGKPEPPGARSFRRGVSPAAALATPFPWDSGDRVLSGPVQQMLWRPMMTILRKAGVRG